MHVFGAETGYSLRTDVRFNATNTRWHCWTLRALKQLKGNGSLPYNEKVLDGKMQSVLLK